MSTEEKMASQEENNKIENVEGNTEPTSIETNLPAEEVINPASGDAPEQEIATVETPVAAEEKEAINQEEEVIQEEKAFEEPTEVKAHQEVEAKLEALLYQKDYSLLNKGELIKELEGVLTTDDVESVKKSVKDIKTAYQLQ